MTKGVEYLPGPDLGVLEPSGSGYVEDARQPLIAWVGRLERGFFNARHAHPRAQLAFCYDGLMRLDGGEDAWFVPDRHGIWIPPGLEHHITTQTAVELHNLFVDARFVPRLGMPDRPTVLRATPLLRGISRRLAPGSITGLSPAEVRRLVWVAFDELTRLERPDLRLPGGRDPRLVAAMEYLLAHPRDHRGLSGVAQTVGVSERTLARLFPSETGLTFRDWRSRMRFMLALEALDQGETSTALADRLGYSGPSAFIAAFRRHFGVPPTAFRKRG